MELYQLTIHQAHALLQKGAISSLELTQALLQRIEQVDSQVRAYLCTAPELALEEAKEADRRRAHGEDSPLLGIPLAVKDVICTRGVQTTCGSRILEGFIPPYDATVVARLRWLGAVLLGKTNTDEFAMGSSTENSGFWATHNPWNLERIPGGSSGGSAAAVASGMCLAALGSDTGGSVRQPAGFCGVCGLKPTYGRVSRYGLVAFASSLDQIGPITHDARDAALLLQAIAGHDPKDSTAVNVPVADYLSSLSGSIKGLRIGVPHEYFVDGIQPGVRDAVLEALETWRHLGAETVDISLPHTEYALPVYYIIAPAEASANLARYDGVRYGFSQRGGKQMWDIFRQTRGEGFGSEVKRRIMLGTYALSAGYYDAYYLKAQKVRTLIRDDFDRALKLCDVIVAPTAPTTAFSLGEKVDDPLRMYLTDVFTLSLNLAGLCGISIPCGFSDGLPVGVQVFGPAFGEAMVLRVADAYQQATDWHVRRPPLQLTQEASSVETRSD